MLEVSSSIGKGSLNRERIASVAGIPGDRRIITILADGVSSINMRESSRRTSENTQPLKRIIDANLAKISIRIPKLTVRTNSYT